jgi:hypothetical protein
MPAATRPLHTAPAVPSDAHAPVSDAGAVETFVFDVSAGEADGVGVATGLRRRLDPAMAPADEGAFAAVARLIREAFEHPRRAADNRAESSTVADADPDAASATFEMPRATSSRGRGETVDKRSALPAWYLSLVVHGTLLAFIALMSVTLPEPLEELNVVLAPEPLEQVEFSEAELTDDGAGAEGVEQLADELEGGPLDVGDEALGGDPGELSVGELAPEALVAGALGEPLEGSGDGSLGDVGLLFGAGSGGGAGGGRGGGGGRDGLGEDLGPQPLAKFFGTKIEGRRIVFVLDNSGSMQGGRLETVIDELKRCVDSLSRDQGFYVVFYSDSIYPLFYPDPAQQYVPATDQNKRMLGHWLDTVELCMGDSVIEALAAASMIEPDVVFLLSDGRVQGEKKMAFLLDGRNRDFPIHTVGVGMGGGAASRRNLQEIATANAGDFREAEVPDAMKELARSNPRPYHSDAPGLVWGRQVRPRRSAR